jgi:hypothetical protein
MLLVMLQEGRPAIDLPQPDQSATAAGRAGCGDGV